MTEIGLFLKKYREKNKIKATDVWKSIKISDSVLSNLETGKTKKPDPLVLKKLADYYQINPIQLYVLAGYLDVPKSTYVFQGIDTLSDAEICHIQQLINLFNENKSKTR